MQNRPRIVPMDLNGERAIICRRKLSKKSWHIFWMTLAFRTNTRKIVVKNLVIFLLIEMFFPLMIAASHGSILDRRHYWWHILSRVFYCSASQRYLTPLSFLPHHCLIYLWFNFLLLYYYWKFSLFYKIHINVANNIMQTVILCYMSILISNTLCK